MSQLTRLVDLYTDEVLALNLDCIMAQLRVPRSMAQAQLLYRRAQGVRHAGDLFRNQGPVLNTESFESWLEHRIALAGRRGLEEDLHFFRLIQYHLFGDHPEALRRATNKRLQEAAIEKPSVAERAEVQVMLFRRWIDGFFVRLRHALQKHAQPFHQKPAQRRDQPHWRKS